MEDGTRPVPSREMAACTDAALSLPLLNLAPHAKGPWSATGESQRLLRESQPGRGHFEIGCSKNFLSLWDFVARCV